MGDPASIAVGMLASAATGVVSGAGQSSAAKKQMAMQKQQADRNLKILEQQQKFKEEEQKRRLKASLASQRARMGAGGISSNSGSASALLQGINNEANRAIAQGRYETELKRQDIHYGLAQAQYQNLLQRKNRQRSLFLSTAQAGLSAGLNSMNTASSAPGVNQHYSNTAWFDGPNVTVNGVPAHLP